MGLDCIRKYLAGPAWSPIPLLLAVLVSLGLISGALAESGPELKPDIPKLDNRVPDTEQIKPSVGRLQGSVERNQKIAPGTPGSFKGANTQNQGHFWGWPQAGRGDRGSMKGNTNRNRINAQAQLGIGIIGVKFVMFMGRPPIINRIFPGTPAHGAGMKVKDIIVAVDGVPTFGLTKEEVYDMIVGTPGTPVTLSVRRGGDYQVYSMLRMDLNDLTDPMVRRDYMMNM